jgi:hypothetical protein
LPEALAKMAILLRACGLTDASFALCDQADSVEQIMLTEVVRAGTWRKLGDLQPTVAAFELASIRRPAARPPTPFRCYQKRRIRRIYVDPP